MLFRSGVGIAVAAWSGPDMKRITLPYTAPIFPIITWLLLETGLRFRRRIDGEEIPATDENRHYVHRNDPKLQGREIGVFSNITAGC